MSCADAHGLCHSGPCVLVGRLADALKEGRPSGSELATRDDQIGVERIAQVGEHAAERAAGRGKDAPAGGIIGDCRERRVCIFGVDGQFDMSELPPYLGDRDYDLDPQPRPVAMRLEFGVGARS